MDVQVDRELIRSEREKRAWSQEHLAAAAGIGARTIQRIEATGIASYESVRAISAALEISVSELRADGASRPQLTTGELSVPSETRHALAARLRFTARWVGTAVALALLAGMGGFLLLHDYQKVRVLRTFEQWVTAEPSLGAANRPDAR
jgi:transcriptional regulator with XRE-family HTH domain